MKGERLSGIAACCQQLDATAICGRAAADSFRRFRLLSRTRQLQRFPAGFQASSAKLSAVSSSIVMIELSKLVLASSIVTQLLSARAKSLNGPRSIM